MNCVCVCSQGDSPDMQRRIEKQTNRKRLFMCTFQSYEISQATAHQTPLRPQVLLLCHRCIILERRISCLFFFFHSAFFSGFLRMWHSGGAWEKRWPSQRHEVAAAAAAWQDSKRTLWGLKVPKASWVISHYGAVTEGSAVNTEIIWAMVNDSAVQAFGMIKDRSSCTRHLSGPWITPPASSWVSGAERIAGEACADTQINMFPLSPLTTPGNGY